MAYIPSVQAQPDLLAKVSDDVSYTITAASPDDRSSRRSVSKRSKPEYVDQLIDPDSISTEEDWELALRTNSKYNFYQSIEVLAYHEESSTRENSIFEQAVGYVALVPTENWGTIRVNVVGAFETDQPSQLQLPAQSGIRRLSIEQIDLPLTENAVLHNVIGTHRSSVLNPASFTGGLVGQRFGASEPDILGLSSKLSWGNKSLTLSAGRIGETQGSLLPGFVETEGRVTQVQFYGPIKLNANQQLESGLQVWRTSGFDEQARNRSGARFVLSKSFYHGYSLGASIAQSDQSSAFILGLSKHINELRLEWGAYYFEPDFRWLNRQIGDNYAGVYWRYGNRRGAWGYGATAEYRRDGIQEEFTSAGARIAERDTLYLSARANYRYSRFDRLDGFYAFRQIDDEFSESRSSTEHRLRTTWNTRFSPRLSANLGLSYQERNFDDGGQDSEIRRAFLSASRQFLNDTVLASELDLTQERGAGIDRDTGRVTLNWSQNFANGASLYLAGNYNRVLDLDSQDDFWSGNLNLNYPFGNRLNLELNLDYNRSTIDFDEVRDLTGLFTDSTIDDRFRQDRDDDQFSALLRLSYSLGQFQEHSAINPIRGQRGTGVLSGSVFMDENQDGIRQLSEQGVPGITVYLDRVYPVNTDQNGRFRIGRVGTGEHEVFIDEAALPLPYMLVNGEVTAVKIRLRGTSSVDIPVTFIQ